MQNFDAGKRQIQIIQIMHSDPIVSIGLESALENSEKWVIALSDLANPIPDLVIADYETAMAFPYPVRRDAAVLVITHDQREWQMHAAINAGIRGYVLQSCDVAELLHAVSQLLDGNAYLCEKLSMPSSCRESRVMLTPRETDVLRLLGEGVCNKLIARELGIGLGTVKSHVKNVMTKLGASARTEAVVLATKHGMLTLDHAAGNYSPA
jgi:DNA-binding NarL/FixJ family response regulator